MMRRNPYHKHKVEDDKYGKFDSKLEYDVFRYLLDMQTKGQITELHRLVPFVLTKGQKYYTKKPYKNGKLVLHQIRVQPIIYLAHMTYVDNFGELHVVNARGRELVEYALKKKLMQERHGIVIEEWKRNKYNEPFTVTCGYTPEYVKAHPDMTYPSVFVNVTLK